MAKTPRRLEHHANAGPPARDASKLQPTDGRPRRELTLLDSTSIIVGIIIGAGIYRSSPSIAALVPNATWLIAVWLFGGFLSLIGALCYAELATAYPYEGGDYVYLTRAFGRPVGFIFAWSQLWIIRPGSIGAMAYAFAEYANQIWPRAEGSHATYVLLCYAVISIVALTGINILGVREGKWTQNLLTSAKIAGLLLIVAVGMFFTASLGTSSTPPAPASGSGFSLSNFGLAMIFVLFTYGGWNEMAYVGAELRDPRRNILRALLLGTVAVTAIYVLINVAFLHALGLEGSRHATAAADVLELAVGTWGSLTISLLICISALSAINGQIFTGARIYYAMGTDHSLYSWLGRWDAKRGTPIRSLLIQGVITLALTIWFGLSRNGFDGMVIFTTPAFWFFLVLVGMSLFVLRRRDPEAAHPYRVIGYPLTPILFCLSCAFMVYSSVVYAIEHRSVEAFWSIAILLIGVGLSFYDPLRPGKKDET